MDKLPPYTLGYAPDGTRCAYLGSAVDARDFIFQDVVYMFTYEWRNLLDVYIGIVTKLDSVGVVFNDVKDSYTLQPPSEFGSSVFVEWRRLLKIKERDLFCEPKSPWQNCGGRSMNPSDFVPDA